MDAYMSGKTTILMQTYIANPTKTNLMASVLQLFS